MNSTRFDRVLRQVLLVPMLAVLVGAFALWWQVRASNHTVDSIRDANERLAVTSQIQQLVLDQETGLRGYQTTRDRRFLVPYENASRELPGLWEHRRQMSNDPDRQALVSQIQALHEQWQLSFATPVIATIQAGGQTGSLELNLDGKRQIDLLRSRMASLNSVTESRRDAEIAHWHQQAHTLNIALLILALAIGLLIGLYTRGQMQQVSAAFHQSHNVLRLRAEETFRSEQQLRATLQAIGEGVIVCNGNGAVLSMNDAAQRTTGWTEADARGRQLHEVFHTLDAVTRNPLEDLYALSSRLNQPVVAADNALLLRPDGGESFIEASSSPVRDKAGALTSVVLVFRDVSYARKSQAVLLTNERLAVAGRLAATIAHEIHNPLDAVSNLLFLMDGNSTPEETAQFLQLAQLEIARVTHISRAMLSLHRESVAPVPIDLKEMIESLLLLLDRHFRDNHVKVVLQLPPGLGVLGFPAELRQVLTNLFTNATEAAGSPNRVAGHDAVLHVTGRTVSAGVDEDGEVRQAGVILNLADNGPGIPENIQQELFKPFFTTKGERGTGLGLWISRGIMSRHGGSLELVSSTAEEDHGTTAVLFFAAEPMIQPIVG